MAVNNDVTEEFQYDISYTSSGSNFELTDVSYDLSIANIPFILKIDNQNPYRRETAQYKKEQFDNSQEPGEQALTGWWVRSQTSWHNGAGLKYYDPGTDYEHVSHRYYDSRGIDVFNVGQATLLPETTHVYTASAGTGYFNACQARYLDTGVTYDCLVSGDNKGILKRIRLNGNADVSSNTTYTKKYTTSAGSELSGHSGTDHPITSVATDGTHYYAVCDGAIHKGIIGTMNSDTIFTQHGGTSSDKVSIHYAKGYLFFGENNVLYLLNTAYSSGSGHTGSIPSAAKSDSLTHIDTGYVWNGVTGGPNVIYASGSSKGRSEIWRIDFNATTSTPTGGTESLLPDLAGATVAVQLPFGEVINDIEYYIGYLALGTNKGVRICTVNVNGDITLGPLLVNTPHQVNAFVAKENYIYAATKVNEGAYTHACAIKIDLSTSFDDGTFAWSYDLEYRSSVNIDSENPFTPNSSEATEIYNLDDRIVLVVQEDNTGELQVEHTTRLRNTGYLETGKIRYGTVEPKFFKYLQARGYVPSGDSISVKTVDSNGNEYDIVNLTSSEIGSNIALSQPVGGQELISIKFVLNNDSTDNTTSPRLDSYQLKSIPGVPRQRLYQFPLSLYDTEMDKYNIQFGYFGRAYDVLQTLEQLEVLGDFVQIKDFRTDETFQGVIEEVRFTNESSPDKDSNGFGGLLLVTVRKL